jgi:hypothetical protein
MVNAWLFLSAKKLDITTNNPPVCQYQKKYQKEYITGTD